MLQWKHGDKTLVILTWISVAFWVSNLTAWSITAQKNASELTREERLGLRIVHFRKENFPVRPWNGTPAMEPVTADFTDLTLAALSAMKHTQTHTKNSIQTHTHKHTTHTETHTKNSIQIHTHKHARTYEEAHARTYTQKHTRESIDR